MPAHGVPSLRDSCHCHPSRARLPPPFGILDACHLTLVPRSEAPSLLDRVINTCPAFGSLSLLDFGHSHPVPLGRALRDYGHYHPVHGVDGLDPTLFAVHSHSGLGPTPTLLIRHPCARNQIVRYFEFLSNQRSHKWYLIGPGRKM
jgi:hypothetical protein